MNLSLVRSSPEAEGGLVDNAMRAINQRIRAERLRVGDPVPSEAGLAVEFGVSRTVVREAFRALAALGIINLGNGRRARVGTIDKDVLGLVIDHAVHTDQVSIQQIYDVRRTIEMRAVALATLRRSEPEAEAINAHAFAMRQAFSPSTQRLPSPRATRSSPSSSARSASSRARPGASVGTAALRTRNDSPTSSATRASPRRSRPANRAWLRRRWRSISTIPSKPFSPLA